MRTGVLCPDALLVADNAERTFSMARSALPTEASGGKRAVREVEYAQLYIMDMCCRAVEKRRGEEVERSGADG